MKKLVIFIMSILAVIPALAQDDDEALWRYTGKARCLSMIRER